MRARILLNYGVLAAFWASSAAAGTLLDIAAGYSSISYRETNPVSSTHFSETAVQLQVDYEIYSTGYYPTKPTFDFGLGGFATVYPIQTNQSGVLTRFVGGDVHMGPAFGVPGWRLQLFAGTYFRRMYVTSSQFGYSNVTGPEFFPVLKHTLENGSSISFYAKYTPIVQNANFVLMSLTNRELSAGAKYTFPNAHRTPDGLRISHPVSLIIDYSALNLGLNGTTGSSTIVTSGISLGF